MIFRTDDFQKVVPVVDAFDPSEHAIFITASENKYLGRLLGNSLLAELRAYADDTDPSNEDIEKFEQLLCLCQLAIGNIVFSDRLQGQSVTISQGGVTTAFSENEKAASDSRLNALREELRNTGFNALESVLSHLYANAEAFPAFAEKKSLIPSLQDFEEYHSLSGSMLSFFALSPIIRRNEQSIKELLGSELYLELVELSGADTSVKQDAKYLSCSYLALTSAAAGLQELPVKIGEMGVFIYPFSESLVTSPRRQADLSSIGNTVAALTKAAESSRSRLEKLLRDSAEELGLTVPASDSLTVPYSPSKGIVVA